MIFNFKNYTKMYFVIIFPIVYFILLILFVIDLFLGKFNPQTAIEVALMFFGILIASFFPIYCIIKYIEWITAYFARKGNI